MNNYNHREYHDFEFLNGCFGNGKIRPTDIDCMVEVKNKFFVMEFKTIGQQIPIGQEIALKNLAKKPGFTVSILWHEKCNYLHDNKIPIKIQTYPSNKVKKISLEETREFAHDWYSMASSF
jgi:hypothetical protein